MSTNMVAMPGPLWLKPKRDTWLVVPSALMRTGRSSQAASTRARTVSNAAA